MIICILWYQNDNIKNVFLAKEMEIWQIYLGILSILIWHILQRDDILADDW